MRVLAHVHTFNDADVIEQALAALRRQTRLPDAILLVDNASTDGTLDRNFPDDIKIIRNSENGGPSGAVGIGFAHALEQGFDWIWVLDADTVPEPDALEKLLQFFDRLPPAQRERLCFIAGWPLTESGEVKHQPIRIEQATLELVPLASGRDCTECDCMLWSGALYRAAAVARIGLPSADYVIDMGEVEYGYRARQHGLTSYIVHNSRIRHDVGRDPGTAMRLYRFGPLSLTFYETSSFRTYYSIRNVIYFWLYQYKPRRVLRALHWVAWRVAPLTLHFVLRPRAYGAQIVACFRGIWHGVTGNMAARY